jgi:GTP cyclohydrolase II
MSVTISARTRLPTRHGELDLAVFRHGEDASDHLALSAGRASGERVLVRVHSECLTGEAFDSLKCDCGAQLDDALARIAEEGGVVVYLRQEGRGIGLADKIRAYALQERGLDTVEANLALGLPADARRYDAAAAFLGHIGVRSVRLLTNNPEKVAALAALGIPVRERVPTVFAPNAINAGYLEHKRLRCGHHLPALGGVRSACVGP